MSPWLIMPIAGAGLGAAKYYFDDEPSYKKDLLLNAKIMQNQGATGIAGQVPKTPSLFGNILAGGAAGLQMGGDNAGKFNEMFGGTKTTEGSGTNGNADGRGGMATAGEAPDMKMDGVLYDKNDKNEKKSQGTPLAMAKARGFWDYLA